MTLTVEPKDVHPEDVLPGELPDDISDKEAGSGIHTPTSTSKAPLASRQTAYNVVTGPVTDALYHVLGIRKRDGQDLDEIATQSSVYDTAQAEFYQPRADWENIEQFDPDFRWTWREENKAIWKVDRKVFAWVLVMFFCLNVQRSNLTTAQADNFLKDLGLTQEDYNIGNTIFRVFFLAAELPSQLISKRLGPDVWIPAQLVIYSIIAASQFWLSGRSSFFAVRALLAAFQGGFIPDAILYLSYWYNKHDLPVRMAFFFTMNYLASMITNFLAVGLLEMRGVAGLAGWRWMFLIEGILTLGVGIASFWLMPPSPSQTKSKHRPNGYLTDREVKIIVNRTLRDDPGKGGMHNRQALSPKLIWEALKSYHIWPLYFISLTFNLPTVPVTNYLQISFRSFGFSRPMANLLAVPSTVFSIINLIIITLVSEAVNNRSFVCMTQTVWLFPCLVALVTVSNFGNWEYFGIATAFLSYPWVHAIQVSWVSTISGTVGTRTVASALYNMSIQLSSIIGANVYQPSDAPRYYTANKAMLAVVVFNLVIVYPGTWLFFGQVNKKRERIWGGMSDEEKSEYLRTTKDEGNKRLDYRFARKTSNTTRVGSAELYEAVRGTSVAKDEQYDIVV